MKYCYSKIISCNECQVREDGELILGIGSQVCVSELMEIPASPVCPNCRARLEKNDFVMVDIPWFPSEKTFSVKSEFYHEIH
jgi:hypothetical protein